jgi:iron complex transport system permease protein
VWTCAALIVVLLATVTIAVTIGPVTIAPGTVWAIVLDGVWPQRSHPWTASEAYIVWQLRLPRVLLSACVGAGLAVVGTALQALVRNPLADPYVFGITSGASVGATLVLVLGIGAFGDYSLSIAAFGGAVGAFALVLALARSGGNLSPMRLILAGLAVAYAMSAVTSFLVFLAAHEGNQGAALSVLFWILGGFGAARWEQVPLPAILLAMGVTLLILHARSLNALLAGDETAATLGVDVKRLRWRLFGLCSLLTGVMVAVSGGIGFVGLMVPHAVRLLVGTDHRRVLPIAMLAGGIFLAWADVLARTLFAPAELPIGIITALSGAPFFMWLLQRRGMTSETR